MSALQELDRELRKLIRDGKATSRPAALALIEKSDPQLAERARAEHKQRKDDAVKKVLQQFDKQVQKDAERKEDNMSAQVTKTEGKKTAADQLQDHAREYYVTGRVATVSMGYVMATEHFPELADAAISEGLDQNIL